MGTEFVPELSQNTGSSFSFSSFGTIRVFRVEVKLLGGKGRKTVRNDTRQPSQRNPQAHLGEWFSPFL